MKRVPVGAAIALAGQLLCGWPAGGQPVREVEPPAAPTCLERPIVVVYLHRLQDSVMEHWTLPADTLANQTVVVRFRLAEDGTLLTYELKSWTNRRVANSVELAFAEAPSFGEIPEGALCLLGRSIEMQFENPT